MAALLCETVTATTMADLVAARDRVTVADMVEVRLDGVKDLDVARAVGRSPAASGSGFGGPIVATCRASWEGGRFDGSEEERHRILAQALDVGASYVDIEWKAGFTDLIARDPSRILLSSHDFAGVPPDLLDRARMMRATGAGTIKVAVATARLNDSLVLRDVARDGQAVVIGMGAAGIPTRLLASQFGSCWTYAGTAAPGQLPAPRMIDDYAFRRIGPSTEVYGVVSSNAMDSLSPVMHNACFNALTIDAVYVPLNAADFEDFLDFASAVGVKGASVTIPFKGDALRAATVVDHGARQVGAVNTLRRSDQGWEATNTDVPGFLAPLHAAYGTTLQGARAAVLGAGGSARAVIVGLRSGGAEVTVYARRVEQARHVGQSLGVRSAIMPPPAGSWDLLVNCTPLGGSNLREESPLPGGPFDGRLVYDLTYGRDDSRLLREARAAGCAVLDGLPMLVAQAERQFEWWTGQAAPAGLMEHAARKRLCN